MTMPLGINVGHSDIDTIHRQLAELVERISVASDKEFSRLYAILIEHTEVHFRHEEQLMSESGFIHSVEHRGEHRQMLNEMRQFARRPLPMARAYILQRLPERFSLHITRMDSLLVAYLRSQE